jgi:hypothetical protein
VALSVLWLFWGTGSELLSLWPLWAGLVLHPRSRGVGSGCANASPAVVLGHWAPSHLLWRGAGAGHQARDCPNVAVAARSSACFNCGMVRRA